MTCHVPAVADSSVIITAVGATGTHGIMTGSRRPPRMVSCNLNVTHGIMTGTRNGFVTPVAPV